MFSHDIVQPYTLVRTIHQGLTTPHNMVWEDRTLSRVRHPELIALYASAPNHVFGQMLGLPGSCVLLPYVPLYRLKWHQENYCNCAPVWPGEHLSRESRKLTVMIQRDTSQPLEDSSESLGFLRINEGPFPGHVHTCPYPDAREGTRAYIVAPSSNSYG